MSTFINQSNRSKGFGFMGTGYTPQLNVIFDDYNLYPTEGNFIYSYDDLLNTINTNVKRINSVSDLKVIKLKNKFSSLGGLLTASTYSGSLGNYETKSTNLFNATGSVYRTMDGEGRVMYTKYDYLNRPVETRYNGAWGASNRKIFDYLVSNNPDYYRIETITDETTDESGETIKKYYDKVGNLKKEEIIHGSTTLATTYEYDDLYRLTSVTSPGGKITAYQYDDHNNISQKVSPDEGTTLYKYDKFGNLRFSMNSGDANFTFSRYDEFKRVLATGQFDKQLIPFASLDPDVIYDISNPNNYTFEGLTTDTAKFLIVNMYDKFTSSGVFQQLSPSLFGTLGYIKGKLVATAFRTKTTDPWSYKIYSYDPLGRVISFWVSNRSNNKFKKITNTYDNLGNVISQNINGDIYTWNDYDEQNRLKEVRSSMHNAKTTAMLDAVYDYDKSDKVHFLHFNKPANVHSREYFRYNVRGRITQFLGQRISETPVSLMGGSLSYYDNDNILSQSISNGGGIWSAFSYTYSYDGFNRLTDAVCTTNNYPDEHFTYDNDGNFLTHTRSDGLNWFYMYTANTNKLSTIQIPYPKSYGYDVKGNIIYDDYRGINSIQYDFRNLPVSMNVSGRGIQQFDYDDAGQRVRKNDESRSDDYRKQYYLRDHTGRELAVYRNNGDTLAFVNLYGNDLIGRVDVNYEWVWVQQIGTIGEGQTHPTMDSTLVYSRIDDRKYYFKDHLGNIRTVVDKNGNLISAQDYYPYGGILENA